MKIRIITVICLFVFLGCKDQPNVDYESEPTEDKAKVNTDNNSLLGAWELTSFYNYENNNVIDSFNTREGYRQVKMYTPTKVMWSKQVPTDSTEWFGYGSYRIEDGQLVEILDYGSAMMSNLINENEEFRFDLQITENSFSQIELDEEGNYIYSENYQRIE